jgi:hypothetical protein
MKDLSPSDLKSILHSKLGKLYDLECCRVMQKDERVLYLTEAKNENQYLSTHITKTLASMFCCYITILQVQFDSLEFTTQRFISHFFVKVGLKARMTYVAY